VAGGNQIERVITDTSTLREAPWVRFVVLVALSYEGMPGPRAIQTVEDLVWAMTLRFRSGITTFIRM